jgi:2-dehydropantoate 2-reductase
VKIVVIGAGAIGCLVGGNLAAAGETVTLVGRPAFAAAVRANGLRVRLGDDEQIVRNLNAVGSMVEAFADASAYDLAVLTVKSYDTATALDELLAATSAPPPILSLH